MTQAIPIELIRTDGGTQIRDCKTMQTKIAEYATAMSEGVEFPPLTVFWDGEHYWLADGFHRLGAYNIVMQALELPGLDIDCDVVEGAQRDAIIFACGVNAAHGIQRTNADKQNAVRTMLTNPLVMINLETGKPWNDSEIARRCHVSIRTVGRYRADLAAEQASQAIIDNVKDSERTVTRGGTTYTMKTANIGSQTAAPKAEQAQLDAETPKPEAKDPPVAPSPDEEESNEGEPDPEPAAETVVEFKSKWDSIYHHLKDIDRAIEALPAPDVAAAKFPETLAHGLTVERCLEIQHWWLEFTRYWAARNPGIKRRHPDFFEEDLSVNAD